MTSKARNQRVYAFQNFKGPELEILRCPKFSTKKPTATTRELEVIKKSNNRPAREYA
jgi:hypothetical protein